MAGMCYTGAVMKHLSQLVWGVGLVAAAAAALPQAPAAGSPEAGAAFAPYQIIVDRAIFGKPPVRPVVPVAAVEAAEQKQAEALAKKITLCAINRTPSGNTAVGLIDNDAKPPRNIYLNVGESSEGCTIIAADYDAETATIEKDSVIITLQLGKGLIGIGAEAAAAVAAVPEVAAPMAVAAARTPRPPPGPPVPLTPEQLEERERARARALYPSRDLPDTTDRSIPDQPVPSNIRMLNRMLASDEIQDESYRARLLKRQEELRQRHEAQTAINQLKYQQYANKITKEEVDTQIRAHNLSLLETGQAPISAIELTPEEDEALVASGVLPPKEEE